MQRWAQSKSPGIDALQAGMLTAVICAPSNHGFGVTYLLQSGGRDAWIGVMIAGPLALLLITALVSLSRAFPATSLLESLPQIIGKPLGFVLRILYILYFLAGAVVTLRRTADWLVDSFLPDTPFWAIAVSYLLICLYIASGGVQVIARANQWFMPFLAISGLLASFGTLPAKDYGLLLPIFQHGPARAFQAAWTATGILGELCVMGMFFPHVQDRKRMLRAGLAGATFAAEAALGPVTGSIATLGIRQAANMPYPTFREWLIMSFARFLERTDLLVVHQWLSGANIRTGVFLYAAATGVQEMTRHRRFPWILVAFGAVVLVVSLTAFPDIIVFDHFMQAVYLPTGVLLGVLLPVGLWGIAAMRGLLTKGGRPIAEGQGI